MKFKTKEVQNSEIVHFADRDLLITSVGNIIKVSSDEYIFEIEIPVSFLKKVLCKSRILRRLLRLDKMNVTVVNKEPFTIFIIYQGLIFYYIKGGLLSQIFKLKHGRNVLHNSIAVIPRDSIIFGEYFGNNDGSPVNIYKIDFLTMKCRCIYTFAAKTIRHVHSCYYDKFENKVWVFTGDFDGECKVLVSDLDFNNVSILGDGTQTWRAVSAFFTKEYVYWIMDSPIKTSRLVKFNRLQKQIDIGCSFPGPVYYSISLSDGKYLLATTYEPGPSVEGNSAHIYLSCDLEKWDKVYSFRHDGLPTSIFKYAIIGFAEGVQSLDRFYVFFEAIKGLDGKSLECSISLEE